MPATEKVSYTFPPETTRQIDELAKMWSAADRPLPKSHVIVEAVRRAWQAETKARRPAGKKS